MFFCMICSQAVQECTKLEKQANELNQQIWELKQVIYELRGLSDMEGPVAKLGQQCREMDFEYTVLNQMTQALGDAVTYYAGYEKRVCSYAEQNMSIWIPYQDRI